MVIESGVVVTWTLVWYGSHLSLSSTIAAALRETSLYGPNKQGCSRLYHTEVLVLHRPIEASYLAEATIRIDFDQKLKPCPGWRSARWVLFSGVDNAARLCIGMYQEGFSGGQRQLCLSSLNGVLPLWSASC